MVEPTEKTRVVSCEPSGKATTSLPSRPVLSLDAASLTRDGAAANDDRDATHDAVRTQIT